MRDSLHEDYSVYNNRIDLENSRWAALIIIIFFLFFGLVFENTFDCSFQNNTITLSHSGTTYTIEFSEIENIDYISCPTDIGNCITGNQTRTYSFGRWTNGSGGEYVLAIYNKIGHCIYIRTKSEIIYLISYEDENTTESMYTELEKIFKTQVSEH